MSVAAINFQSYPHVTAASPFEVRVGLLDAAGHVIPTATDRVLLFLGGTQIGAVDAVNGIATFSNLVVSTVQLTTLTATDGNLHRTASLNVHPATGAPATVIMVLNPDPSVLGEPVKVLLLVSSPVIGGTISGTFTLDVNGVQQAIATVAPDGSAVLLLDHLPVGKHTILAVYSGDTIFAAATSLPEIQTVNP